MRGIEPSTSAGEPLVSVIMCVRDGEKYVQEALDSIAAQGIAALEILVILDGSSDRSEAIARSHLVSPTIVSQAALGLPTAMNRGMELARGRFINFLDCDDVWPNHWLEKMLGALALDPDADGVFSGVTNTDERLVPIRAFPPARMMNAMLIKRASAYKVGALRADVKHTANIDWISRATAQGLKLIPLDETTMFRRIHGDNMGVRDRTNARHDLLRVVRDHHRRSRQ